LKEQAKKVHPLLVKFAREHESHRATLFDGSGREICSFLGPKNFVDAQLGRLGLVARPKLLANHLTESFRGHDRGTIPEHLPLSDEQPARIYPQAVRNADDLGRLNSRKPLAIEDGGNLSSGKPRGLR